MKIQLIKTKNQELLKVSGRVFKKGCETYNHLMNKLTDARPQSVKKNMHKGRPNGKVITFDVKGTLPSYGYSLRDALSPDIISRLYKASA
jgi:hypothetical protein